MVVALGWNLVRGKGVGAVLGAGLGPWGEEWGEEEAVQLRGLLWVGWLGVACCWGVWRWRVGFWWWRQVREARWCSVILGVGGAEKIIGFSSLAV